MYKILTMWAALAFCFSVAVTAQNNPADYSESISYKPREVEIIAPSKKKDKKSKKETVEPTPTPDEPILPANPSSGDLTIGIPFFVYDKTGKAVPDLRADEIKVFVDDAEREFSGFEAVKTPREILLILDTSPSLAYNDVDLRKVVLKLIEALPPGDKLQIISFNSEVSVVSEPTADAEMLKKAVKKIKTGDGTSIYEATREIFGKYLNGKTPPVVIILSDGVDTTSRRVNYMKALVEAERRGAVVFPFYYDSFEFMTNNTRFPVSGFGINNRRPNAQMMKEEYAIGRAFMQDLAALSGGRTFAVKNLADLGKRDFEEALKFIKPHYRLSINSPETAGKFQRRQIKVRVLRPGLTVFARGSFITGEN